MFLCISEKWYDTKPTPYDITRMKYNTVDVDIDGLVDYISQGHSFCGAMKDNKRERANFIGTNIITYDIDHCSIDMDTCMHALPIKPTVAYTTPSNGMDGMGYRYRLLYCLDEPMTSYEEFHMYSHSLSDQLTLQDIVGTYYDKGKGKEENCIDGRSFYPEQYWNGCRYCNIIVNKNNILYKNNILLNNDYRSNIDRNHNGKVHKSISQCIINKSSHYGLSDTFDESVKNDFLSMKYMDFIDKYKDIYPNMEQTPMEYDDTEPIIYYPENYYEIRRPWKRINGETMKIKDGEGRRRKLFLNGIIRRMINPEISIENMLYNIVYEFEYYYLNDGNKIDKYTLLSIVNNIMNEDISKYREYGKPKNKFKINPLYCKKHGMKALQVLGQVRNKKQYIGEFYDFTKTDKENIEIMKEYGLEIKIATLKRWKKENGIRKYKKSS